MSNVKLPNGMELVFAPGCFDNFEGTQEELDALIKEITESFANGDALTNSKPLDPDEFLNNLSEEELEALVKQLGLDIDEEGEIPTSFPGRTLQ